MKEISSATVSHTAFASMAMATDGSFELHVHHAVVVSCGSLSRLFETLRFFQRLCSRGFLLATLTLERGHRVRSWLLHCSRRRERSLVALLELAQNYDHFHVVLHELRRNFFHSHE